MAKEVGSLYVSIRAQMAPFLRSLRTLKARTITMASGIARSFAQTFTGALRRGLRVLKWITLGITAAFAAVALKAAKLAMEGVESENLFTESMGRMATAARRWSEVYGKAVGRSALEVRRTIGTFNVMLGSMGFSEQAAYKMAQSFTMLADDMSSFYNLPHEDAFQKLQSGITGEIEPLKRLGINIKEVMVEQWALTHGLIKQGQKLSEIGKIVARYGLILEQTTKAQGDLARTATSPLNMLRRLGASMRDFLRDMASPIVKSDAFKNFLSSIALVIEKLRSVNFGPVIAQIRKAFQSLSDWLVAPGAKLQVAKYQIMGFLRWLAHATRWAVIQIARDIKAELFGGGPAGKKAQAALQGAKTASPSGGLEIFVLQRLWNILKAIGIIPKPIHAAEAEGGGGGFWAAKPKTPFPGMDPRAYLSTSERVAMLKAQLSIEHGRAQVWAWKQRALTGRVPTPYWSVGQLGVSPEDIAATAAQKQRKLAWQVMQGKYSQLSEISTPYTLRRLTQLGPHGIGRLGIQIKDPQTRATEESRDYLRDIRDMIREGKTKGTVTVF